MRSGPLILACCLLALATAAVLWLAADPAPPPAPSAESLGGDDSARGDASLASAAERDPQALAASAEPSVGATADQDPTADRAPAVLAPTGAPRVRVLRGDPPAPVPAASVYFLTEADALRAVQRSSPSATAASIHRLCWPELYGQSARTGDDGLLQLPAVGAPLLCAAVHEGGFAFAVVPPRDREFPLTLQADETLRLLTRRGDDPIGSIPVAVLQRRGDAETRTLWQGTTDREGRATVPHFQGLRETKAGDAEASELFAAVATVPTATASAFAGRPAPAEPVVVAVPDLGQVLVHLVDHGGRPLLSPATVGCGEDRRGGPARDQPLPFSSSLLQPRVQKPAGEQPVLLPFRELGPELKVFARYPHDNRRIEIGPVPGPRTVGERVEVKLPLHSQQLVLAGRVLDADGRPWPAPLQGALWRRDRDLLPLRIEPLADGRFDLVLAARTDADEFWLELRQTPAPGPDGQRPEVLGLRQRTGPLRPGQRLELGDLVLGPLPLLCHGLVVDDLGEAVPGAFVEVQQQEAARPDRRGEAAWRTIALASAPAETDGHFHLYGWLPSGQLRVRADTDRHFAASQPLWQPGQELRIQIQRNGIVHGTVLLPDWLPPRAVTLELRPVDQALHESDTRRVELSGGRFRVEPLRPGRYDGRLFLRNVPAPFLVLADVWVQPGRHQDPRCAPLDLRTALHRYRLRAVDAGGRPQQPSGPIMAKLVDGQGQPSDSTFRWQGDRAELITPSPTAELLFFGRGHRTTRLLLSPGDHEVLLPGLMPVLVDLPGLRSLCGPSRRVRISVLLQGDTGLPADANGHDQHTGEQFHFGRRELGRSSGGWLEFTDTVAIPLMQSGKYQVLLRPHATDTERSPQGELNLGTFAVDIDTHAQRPLLVPIDAAAVAAMLQQLDQRHLQSQTAARRDRPATR